MAKKQSGSTEIIVQEIQQGEIEFCILGTSPLILNCMSEKAKQGLLFPQAMARDSKSERARALKHVPVEEFRSSVYRSIDKNTDTLLVFPSTAFKSAMMNAALEMPGTKKSQIGRLVYVKGQNVSLYGVPQLRMDVVRMADISKTPDVRTRAILSEWACKVSIKYIKPAIRYQAVANLLAAAGVIIGVGDFRQEKGKGSFGQFSIVEENDETFQRIIKTGARVAQEKALENPICFDAESENLLTWFNAEVQKLTGGKSEAA